MAKLEVLNALVEAREKVIGVRSLTRSVSASDHFQHADIAAVQEYCLRRCSSCAGEAAVVLPEANQVTRNAEHECRRIAETQHRESEGLPDRVLFFEVGLYLAVGRRLHHRDRRRKCAEVKVGRGTPEAVFHVFAENAERMQRLGFMVGSEFITLHNGRCCSRERATGKYYGQYSSP